MARRKPRQMAPLPPELGGHGTEQVEYNVYGACNALFDCEEPEVLLEGVAGSGKTRACLERINQLAEQHPGFRGLICRLERTRLTDSALKIFEEHVLPKNHPALRGAARMNRHSYTYLNGSEIVVAGLEDPERTYSAEYDFIVINEATEIDYDTFQKLKRAMRGRAMGFCQILAECNPSHEQHWLNQRAKSGMMKRLKATFKDNPVLPASYIVELSKLTGYVRARLYEGRWVAAEGMVFEAYKRETHVLKARLIKGDRFWQLHVHEWEEPVDLTWFMASMDWGFTAPGVLQVWGIDADRTAYLVREIYRTGKDMDWWAEQCEIMREKFDIQRFICDPADPEHIALLNRRLGSHGGFWLAHPAVNSWDAGIAIARERLQNREVFFLEDALVSADPTLSETNKPKCLIDEIPGYILDAKASERGKEKSDPTCADHSMDSMRYGLFFLDTNDWQPSPIEDDPYPAGSFGRLLGHADVEEEVETFYA